MTIEVKIGIQNVTRELTVETDDSNETVTSALSAALEKDGVFSLIDTKGKVTLVPAAKLAYVEIGRSTSGQVGFRS
jgi:hypothetical protein